MTVELAVPMPTRKIKPTLDRFLEKVEGQADGCWLWTGAGGRYGTFGIGRAVNRIWISAHRFSYQQFRGPIPDGLQIDHICNNPRCVNPYHMQAVTASANIRRSSGPPGVNARKTHCSRGHEFTPENTYLHRGKKRHCKTCQIEGQRRRRRLARVG